MKLALVSLDYLGGSPQLGLGYIASYLRKYGNFNHIVIIDKENLIRGIKREKPDIVGISSVTTEFQEAKRVSGEIKSKFDIPTIIGGVHISMLPNSLPKSFDIGVIGEGEQTMLELVQLYEKTGELKKNKLKRINGIIFRERGKIILTKPRKLIRPLDSIPFPARDLFKMKEYYLIPRNIPQIVGKLVIGTHMIPSRGCPYRCAFCASPKFWKSVRFYSAEYVVEEIKELIERYQIKYISFFDDLFIASKSRLKKIVKLIKEEKINEKARFGLWGRTNLITDEICKLLKEMGVDTIGFGFESGSEKILNYLKKSTATIKDSLRAIKLCKKYGFNIHGTFIIGNPNETKNDIEQTYKFIKNNPIEQSNIYILTPLPGTEVWELAKKENKVSEDMNWSRLDNFGTRGNKVFFLPSRMSEEEFLRKYKEINDFTKLIAFSKYKFDFRYLTNPAIIKKIVKRRRDVLDFLKVKISNFFSM